MRTLQHQLQDLADWINYIEVDPEPTADDFSEGPLRAAWCAVASIHTVDDASTFRDVCEAVMRRAMEKYPDGARLFERICRVIPSDKEAFRSMAEIALDLLPVEWLWERWLARRSLNLMVARPGEGKSLICLDLAGRVMTASPWPDGSPACLPPAKVIYVDGENIPQVHNARAEAWGLPRERLYPLLPDGDDVLVNLGTSKYQELLVQMVFRVKPALVIIDSLGAVMGKGENAIEDVRGTMAFLAGLAQQYDTAVLAIHHLRKTLAGQLAGGESIDQDQIRGSGHISASGRVIIGVTTVQTGPKPSPNGPRKLQVIKSNFARHPDPLGVTFEPIPSGVEGAGDHVRVVYDAHPPEQFEMPRERTAAQEWLIGFMEQIGRPIAPAAVVAAGMVAGFSRSTIFQARKALEGEIVNTAGHRHPANCWELAPLDFELSKQSKQSEESELSRAVSKSDGRDALDSSDCPHS